MSDKWHGGKGDKSRISDMDKFSRNMEKIYERKNWRFWAVWDGYNLDTINFDESDLEPTKQISYAEFVSRIRK